MQNSEIFWIIKLYLFEFIPVSIELLVRRPALNTLVNTYLVTYVEHP